MGDGNRTDGGPGKTWAAGTPLTGQGGVLHGDNRPAAQELNSDDRSRTTPGPDKKLLTGSKGAAETFRKNIGKNTVALHDDDGFLIPDASKVPPWRRTGAEYIIVRAEMETWYGNLWHRLKWWWSA